MGPALLRHLRQPAPPLPAPPCPLPRPQLYSAQYSTFGPVPEQNPVPHLASPAPAPSCTPPLYPHNGGGGSVLGINGHSTLPAHLRHPVTNDMYAVVTKPAPAPGYRTLSSPAPSPAPGHTTSPVTYIMDTHPASHTGQHLTS